MDFKLHLIETITNNFAEDQKVGSGGYGNVYRAMYDGEDIAVKKLHPLQGLDDKQFDNEYRNLTMVRHNNIVRLIGYCYESRHKYMEHKGELVFAKAMERVLCFEYMEGGSLDKHIQDESCGLEWPTCYKIIKGTCEGLNHLHSQGKPIFHLDLKPGNILLDKSMTPKIADLGLSRLVGSTKTRQTEMRDGTLVFMPPEYVDSGFISEKFDVFSLGIIIIKMLAGNMSYFRCSEMSPKQFIELVSENWTKKLQAKPGYSSQEIDILGVTSCVEIALRCVDKDRNKRPCIKDIVQELEELEAKIEKMSPPPNNIAMALPSYVKSVPLSQGIEAQELHFHLYIQQFPEVSPTGNQIIVAIPPDSKHGFGVVAVNDWAIYDDIGIGKRLVGHAQGLHFGVSKAKTKWFHCFNLVFTDDRFKGSSFKVLGDYAEPEGSWAIVGGTGEFTFAQGSITSNKNIHVELGNILELHVRAVCLTFGRSLNPTTKIGPWGGDGGTAFSAERPVRLESVTISSSDVLDSLAFSYIDQAGASLTAGPWGGDGGSSATILLDQLESVKEVSGTTATYEGQIVVSSLALLTNVRKYGPYGKRSGTPFSVPVGDNSSVAGFFVRAGRFVDAIGVYVHTPVPN